FFIYQGFNEKNGWMHTSSYTDVMDEFLETITEKDGKFFYQYGNEERAVHEVDITLNYTTGDSIQQRDFKLYRTHHGPVTGMQDDKWIATAMMWDPSNALQQAFIRTKTSTYNEFKKMMDYR